MKKLSKLTFWYVLLLIMSMYGTKASAHDIEVENADGVTIYYNWINNNTELAVSFREGSKYSGNVVIPASVTNNGNTYSVTSVGADAFGNCSGLTSIEIPNSVSSIGYRSFYGCTG